MIKVESNKDTPEAVVAPQSEQQVEGDVPGVNAQSAEESGESAESVSGESADETAVEAAAGEESETSQEDGAGEVKGQKKQGKVQKRISEIVRQRNESRDKYNAAELEIARLRSELANAAKKHEEPVVPKETKVSSGEPKDTDFENLADYYKALADWQFDQRELAKKKDADELAMKNEQKGHFDRYNKNLEELKKSNADVDEVFDSVSDIGMPVILQQAIVESPFNAELAYELSKNRDLLAEMCQMSYGSVQKIIGKLEAKIEERKSAAPSSQKKIEKKVTSAPAPITPVKTKGSGGAKTIYDAANMSQREYEDMRRADKGA